MTDRRSSDPSVLDLHKRVQVMAACFTILDNWEVFADCDGEVSESQPLGTYFREVTVNETKRRAHIKPWGLGEEDSGYVLHEVLHVVLRAYREAVEAKTPGIRGIEETLIQNLCAIFEAG